MGRDVDPLVHLAPALAVVGADAAGLEGPAIRSRIVSRHFGQRARRGGCLRSRRGRCSGWGGTLPDASAMKYIQDRGITLIARVMKSLQRLLFLEIVLHALVRRHGGGLGEVHRLSGNFTRLLIPLVIAETLVGCRANPEQYYGPERCEGFSLRHGHAPSSKTKKNTKHTNTNTTNPTTNTSTHSS